MEERSESGRTFRRIIQSLWIGHRCQHRFDLPWAERSPSARREVARQADAGDAFAVEAGDAVVHAVEHALHLMVAALAEGEPREVGLEDFEIGGKSRDVLGVEMETAGEGFDGFGRNGSRVSTR